jgi:arylformamidase
MPKITNCRMAFQNDQALGALTARITTRDQFQNDNSECKVGSSAKLSGWTSFGTPARFWCLAPNPPRSGQFKSSSTGDGSHGYSKNSRIMTPTHMRLSFWFLLPCVLLTAATAPAQVTPRVHRDIAYSEPRTERQLLDVYAPSTGSSMPVVVWIHGGGWMRGGKNEVDRKPAAFVEKGFLFVPVNYRFIPAVTMDAIVRDVAKSIGWVHTNIAHYGGDPKRIFIMGHSAGAQLAALLCTDSRYIERESVPRSSVKGCVPVDGDTYDVPLQIATTSARRKGLKQPAPKMGYAEKFGNLEQQRELSAVNYVASNRGIPPFLLLHVADHTDTAAQAYRLWAALDQAGVPAKLFGADETDHVKLDRDLGVPGDPATKALFDFTDHLLGAQRQ